MVGSISQEELLGGSGVTADMEKDAADAICGMDHGLIDGAGLIGMLVSQLEGIVGKLVERIAWILRVVGRRSDTFIADIDPCAEAGKVDIDPIWILRYGVKEAAVFEHVGIDGIFEAKGITGPIEGLVLMGGEIDAEISPSFWRVRAVAGLEAGKGQ